MTVLNGLPPEKVLGRSPVPSQWELGSVPGPDGQRVVCLEIRTPSGETTVFFMPEQAKVLADGLRRAAEEALAQSLILPQPLIPPDIRGNGKGPK